MTDEEEVLSANGTRYIMTYEGEKGFTFIQEKEEAVPTSLTSTPVNGDPVHIRRDDRGDHRPVVNLGGRWY